MTGGSQEGDSTLYYCNDANFNVTALVDAASGAVVERYWYEPYGQPHVCAADWTPRENNASAYANEILFTGHRLDAETGLYHTPYRPYHPTLGRWSQPDEDYYDDLNLSQYVGSNPLNLTDPSGAAANCNVVVKRIDVHFERSSLTKQTRKDVKKRTGDKPPAKQLNVGHTWIEFPGGSVGFWPGNDKLNLLYSTGKTMNPDLYAGKPADHTWPASESQDPGRRIEAGRSTGTTCDCTDCDSIYDCIGAVGNAWNNTAFIVLGRNCRSFVKDALTKCCLDSGESP